MQRAYSLPLPFPVLVYFPLFILFKEEYDYMLASLFCPLFSCIAKHLFSDAISDNCVR